MIVVHTFVYAQEHVGIRAERDGDNVLAILEWKSVRLVAGMGEAAICSRKRHNSLDKIKE